jgi:hypothetical protein
MVGVEVKSMQQNGNRWLGYRGQCRVVVVVVVVVVRFWWWRS